MDMSRTKRAQSGDRWWRDPARAWVGSSKWSRRAETFAKYWESDCIPRTGPRKGLLKEATNTSRRADTRKETYQVSLDGERDYLDRETLYKGFIWHFD
jgi:hypothetical protein